MTSAIIVAVLVAYLAALLAIGWWGSRESDSVAGYYLAGKKLPSWVIAFSSNATGESAWLLLGLTGMGYAVGVHALWVVLGEVLGVTLGLLDPMGGHGLSAVGAASAVSFAGIGLAFLGAPQLLARFMSARDRGEIVDGSLIAVLCVIVFDVGAVFSGMAGRALFPALADPERIYPTLTARLFPDVFTGLFLVIVLAAAMSTVDSLLILVSSAVVRDVVQKILRPELSEQRLSLYAKLTTLVIGALAIVFALEEVRVLFWFILFAWSGLASAFAPVVLCSLFWKRTSRAGAIAGMLGGFLTAVTWVLVFKESFYGLYEMLPGFLVGLALTIGVSQLGVPPEGASEELDAVRRVVGPPFPGLRRAGPRASDARNRADAQRGRT